MFFSLNLPSYVRAHPTFESQSLPLRVKTCTSGASFRSLMIVSMPTESDCCCREHKRTHTRNTPGGKRHVHIYVCIICTREKRETTRRTKRREGRRCMQIDSGWRYVDRSRGIPNTDTPTLLCVCAAAGHRTRCYGTAVGC